MKKTNHFFWNLIIIIYFCANFNITFIKNKTCV